MRKPVACLIYAAEDFLYYRTLFAFNKVAAYQSTLIIANDLVSLPSKVKADFDFTKKR